jgi:hypothetical protein
MIHYAALVTYDEAFEKFIIDSERRYREAGTAAAFIPKFKNKFLFTEGEDGIIFSEFETIPPIYLLFVVATVAAALLTGPSPWLIIPGVLSLTGFFWSASFYKWVFRKGLKKAGYAGRLEFISAARALREVLV